MTESSSFSSLLDLVDSHLSKCSLKTSNELSTSNSEILLEGSSGTNLPSPARILPLSPFNVSESPTKSVLDEQISNMLKVKAKQDSEKLANEDQNKDYVIDLVNAIQVPNFPEPNNVPFKIEDKLEAKDNSQNYLPCTTDISYILIKKVKRGKCSSLGKVLTTRQRRVNVYLDENARRSTTTRSIIGKSRRPRSV